jgi:hypothetical protein
MEPGKDASQAVGGADGLPVHRAPLLALLSERALDAWVGYFTADG